VQAASLGHFLDCAIRMRLVHVTDRGHSHALKFHELMQVVATYGTADD
jgi:hypothetical protein